jgi:hypothetical protein
VLRACMRAHGRFRAQHAWHERALCARLAAAKPAMWRDSDDVSAVSGAASPQRLTLASSRRYLRAACPTDTRNVTHRGIKRRYRPCQSSQKKHVTSRTSRHGSRAQAAHPVARLGPFRESLHRGRCRVVRRLPEFREAKCLVRSAAQAARPDLRSTRSDLRLLACRGQAVPRACRAHRP